MEASVREDYFSFLRFASVGADPSRLRDCVACAGWLKDFLVRLGFSVSFELPASGPHRFAPPVVLAVRDAGEGAPRVLVYGHYDVQPADPLEAWLTPPFEPTEKDGRVYCRGAQDDKGQLFAFLCGLRDFLDTPRGNSLSVTLCLDGQEESGSPALAALAPSLARRLAADVLLVCDTSAAEDLRPAIVAGLRGVSHLSLSLTGPSRDLHSGEYGGIAPNPAQALASMLASLHRDDGSVAVDGFYDGIEPPTDEERRLAVAGSPSDDAYARDIGCAPTGGRAGSAPAVRAGFEPTLEINGLAAGYAGPGVKTVIPATAVAKLSLRLVPGQSPQRLCDAVVRHLEARCPRGLTLAFDAREPGSAGFRLPLSSPVFRLAESVLAEMDPRGAVFLWEGASIPVVSLLGGISGAAPLLVGWGQAGDRIHSPNESFSFVQFDRARTWARRILEALA